MIHPRFLFRLLFIHGKEYAKADMIFKCAESNEFALAINPDNGSLCAKIIEPRVIAS